MSFPSECPKCGTVLAFPDSAPRDPIRCPVCNSRFMMEGRKLAVLDYTDYYRLLGIEQNATDEQIRKAVRAKVLAFHPDRNPDDPGANEKLREVVKAKELLTDSVKRRSYDAVHNARALSTWAEAQRREHHDRPIEYRVRPEEYRRQPWEYGRTPRERGVRIETPYERARERRRQTGNYEDIDHLVDEIEVIFMQAGVPINLSGKKGYRDYARVRSIWQSLGMLSLGLAGLLFGLLNGKPAGGVVLALLGGILGWVLTSYPGGLVVLAMFIARMFVFSFLIALGAAKLGAGTWLPDLFGALLKVFNIATATGAAALGLWWIGASTLRSREPFFVHHTVLRQGALGAWMGGLWALFLVLVFDAEQYGPLHATAAWWFLLFTAYLILDTQVFGRTWVFVHERK